MKKLLIDANPCVPYLVSGRVNGIGRTNIELIKALDAIPQEDILFEIELYTQNVRGVSAKQLGTRFKTRHAYLRDNPRGNTIAKHLRIRELLSHYDLMHITHNYHKVAHLDRCIVTIHDAMMFSYPESFLGHDTARLTILDFTRKAKAILTCSENSKREIAEYMGVPLEKIHVAPWGVDHSLLYPREVKSNRFTGNKPYFIAVSCDIGRKNTIAVVKAFIEFSKNDPEHELVCVWRNPSNEVLQTIEKNPSVKNKIHFASNISNEELAELYCGSSCSFFPSRYEGFGLPIAESLACGTPVVTCRNSSLEEVGGSVAFYVDPDDISGMAKYMEDFENGTIRKENLIKENAKQSMLFTWENCSRLTLNVYRECLGV